MDGLAGVDRRRCRCRSSGWDKRGVNRYDRIVGDDVRVRCILDVFYHIVGSGVCELYRVACYGHPGHRVYRI